MQKITTIIFDFGGVILDIDFNLMSNFFAELGVERFNEMYSQQKADHLFKHLEEGKLSEKEFYDAFRRSIQIKLTDEQIKNAWNSMLLSYREDALQTLTELRHKYKLYLLSNTNSIHLNAFTTIYQQQIGRGKLEDYFDKVYYSHEIGLRKPDKEAYEYVVQENNLHSAEVLFIDDTIKNVEAAANLGMQTILLQPGMRIQNLNL